ncbi:sugar-transfer associated ATP-grasp domain-containing protein [Aquimarina sp. W85]|uniref:sugar-transfer associated ATP-grasp domain-containing protein n=1 Tax=Aquimarina rhodophyticola TaxID=3342246 RepID=UPI0036716B2D
MTLSMINKYNKQLMTVVRDRNKKPYLRIALEAIHFGIFKKEFPSFYFGKFLYRKGIKNYNQYLSSKEVDKITFSKKFHKYEYASLLRNKLAFSLFTENNKLATPKLISYNFKKTFFLNSKTFTITSKYQLYDFFSNYFELTSLKKIFLKPLADMGGVGCMVMTKDTLKEDIKIYGSNILASDCVHQEVVIQHSEINKIYAHCINTIRFDTYIDKGNNIHILSAMMRFGQGGSFVDNASAGGFYVPLDMINGELKEKGCQRLKYGGKELLSHPDTGVIFKGYKIPFFKEACDLVIQAVTKIPDRIVGWDIAISKDGPVLIEGNDNNSFITPDIAYGGYLGHPMFQEIMKEA